MPKITALLRAYSYVEASRFHLDGTSVDEADLEWCRCFLCHAEEILREEIISSTRPAASSRGKEAK